jgi:hypothetical protein
MRDVFDTSSTYETRTGSGDTPVPGMPGRRGTLVLGDLASRGTGSRASVSGRGVSPLLWRITRKAAGGLVFACAAVFAADPPLPVGLDAPEKASSAPSEPALPTGLETPKTTEPRCPPGWETRPRLRLPPLRRNRRCRRVWKRRKRRNRRSPRPLTPGCFRCVERFLGDARRRTAAERSV